MLNSTMLICAIFVFLATLNVSNASKPKLEQLIPLCSKADKKLNECAQKSGQLFIPILVKGIPDYGFPPIDPLKVPFMGLSQSEGPVGLKLNISDTTHVGVKNTKVNSVRLDTKKNHWEIDLFFPNYSITGVCDLGGKILLLPISGHGPCEVATSDLKATVLIDGNLKTKNGKNYFKISEFQVKVIFSKGFFHLEGLFGGNQELGAAMNRFLNENAVEVLNEMKSTLETVWSQLYGSLIARILENVPYSELFKP